ncbi:Rne/Rng family ribonuclease [Priestia megaterium]|uniref:Rne/Rng family ribonuclease n=1 Tax=Priestia megaterium TaxID=1404 RepID=UPI002E24708D|nr:Rne/Rng family ribonuclease [Priestia megaterium]MED3880795.1 Rne/Rng family ribonuclease [Priestia megaterium]
MYVKACIINAATSSKRIAVINDKALEKIYLEEQSENQIIGDIYWGKVVKVLPHMQAAFIDIGLSMNGFIHRNELVSYQQSENPQKDQQPMSAFIREGEKVLVQVVKEGIGTKGPKLTGIVEFSSEELVYLPHGNYVAVSKKIVEPKRQQWKQLGERLKQGMEGFLFRTAIAEKSEAAVQHKIKELQKKYERLERQTQGMKAPTLVSKGQNFLETRMQAALQQGIDGIVVDDFDLYQHLQTTYPNSSIEYYKGNENIFSFYDVERQIEKLLKRIVWLKSGGYIVIDETEAMTVVDVNTGKFSGKDNIRKTMLQTNMEAAYELSKQMQLRHLGGMILIDFINMPHKEDRTEVERYMKKLCEQDEVRTNVVGFTELGILQLTRKKVRNSIGSTLTMPCNVCEGTGKMIDSKTAAFQIERVIWEHRGAEEEAIWIETRSDVINEMKAQGFLNALEEMVKKTVYLTPSDDYTNAYVLRQLGSNEQIQKRVAASI